MKKVAFFVQHMICGGVETSLIALLGELEKTDLDISVYLISASGEFVSQIPKSVKIIEIPMSKKIRNIIPIGGIALSIKNCLKNHRYINIIIMIYNYIYYHKDFSELNINFDEIPLLEIKYDIAINYHIHSPFLVKYINDKVISDLKFAWIHNDFSSVKYNVRNLKPYLDTYNNFFAVSNQVLHEFKEILPEYAEKADLFYNIIPKDKIINKANVGKISEYNQLNKNIVKILSVGRLEIQKGFDVAISTCKKLSNEGVNFHWFIVGEGSERSRLEKMILRNNLQNYITLLGKRLNPYPYFKDCDIYVQTSRHEGYGITIAEAKIFNKPIVCTNVAGASEQIRDKFNGFIVECDASKIAEKIKILVNDQRVREIISNNLKNGDENIKSGFLISKYFLDN